MPPITTLITAAQHQLYGSLRQLIGADLSDECSDDRDRGAVSLEQVLWFVAAGVSVAVIAAILWNKIQSAAEDSNIVEPGL